MDNILLKDSTPQTDADLATVIKSSILSKIFGGTETGETQVKQSKLNKKEKQQYAQCVAAIKKNLEGFVTVGYHLDVIRTQRLYRETHTTFALFVQETFGMSVAQAYRSIGASKCVVNLDNSNKAVAVPKVESHARELIGLTEEQQIQAGTLVKQDAGENPSAADFKKAADTVKGKTKINSSQESKPNNLIKLNNNAVESVEQLATMLDETLTSAKTGKENEKVIANLKASLAFVDKIKQKFLKVAA